ncbi:hypothetical protein CJD36_017500 [Flavipsychrobacter stenotrophus]|uniref:Carboxypeptidase-like regulatory domain-containing protein n=1 Tax=Flavipsychrobacter stenotrophus TaxID=2077091 RepID=A0A2S7SSZ7_9BACT|nr:carboxypeptidase-like regulatory domain-containing protein [Flavipsychrobacter stenotrophus]PQJ09725.1 hypothetical protein CJD36_017500 [Flavipsychrobacter stenotrophus]
MHPKISILIHVYTGKRVAMKKQTSFQIDIPKPCSQSWDDMTSNGQGRHCDSCRKTVIDFTSWSDSELYGFFASNRGHVCGRFLSTQVGRQIHIPHQPHSRLYRIAVAMGLTLLFVHTPELRAQSRPPIVAVDSLLMSEGNVKIDSVMTEIRGVVTDNKKEPMVNAAVQIKQNGVLKGGTITDFDGNYSVKGLDSGQYEVIVSYVGYKTTSRSVVVLSNSVENVRIVMDTSSEKLHTMGVLIYYRTPLIDKYKHSYIIRPQW